MGSRGDEFNILDKKFILTMFGKDKNKSKERYMGLVFRTREVPLDDIAKEEVEFTEDKTEYRSERKILVRDFSVEKVIQYVADKFEIDKVLLHLKYQKEIIPIRGILVLLLRNLCNASCNDICGVFGNITSSRVSKLSSVGVDLICNDERYKNIVNEFLACYC